MSLVQVSSRQFRDNQAMIFDMADRGDDIFIQRGAKKSYMLIRVSEEDFVLSPEAEKRIAKSREEYRKGKTTICKTLDEALAHFDAL